MVSVGAREKKGRAAESAVFGLIVNAAEEGLRCPTNPGMAGALGLTLGQVEWAIRTMAEKSIIRIDSYGGARRAIVLATGQATNWTHGQEPECWSGDSTQIVRRKTRHELLLDIIEQKAAAGEEMPRTSDLAEALVCTDETVTRDLRGMVVKGIISIGKIGAKRQITIIATGAKTATPQQGGGPRRQVLGKRDPAKKMAAMHDDAEEEAPPVPASLVPCARRGCEGAAAIGRAYCCEHEMEVAA